MSSASVNRPAPSPRASTTRRRKSKGRSTDYSYIGVPHYILKSQEFAALSPYGVKLLFELAKEYKGGNNGDFSAAYSVLKARGWRSPGTLSAALKELLGEGWIVTTRQGGRHRCSLYALTWWPIDECGGKLEVSAELVARHDWKKTQNVVAIRSDVVAERTNTSFEAA